MATFAAPSVQMSGSDAALLHTDLLVEVEQILRQLRGDAGALAGSHAELPLDVGDHTVAPSRHRCDLSGQLVPLGHESREAPLRVVAAFHDLQHGVFKVAATLLERCDLGLQVLELT